MSAEEMKSWLSRSIAAWSRGDREAWLSEVPPGWEMHTSGLFPGLRAVYRGREGAVELWDDMRGPWHQFALTVERIEAVQDKVLGLVTFTVKGRDGIETSRPWAYVVTFQDGVPSRTDNFSTWAGALEALGLSE